MRKGSDQKVKPLDGITEKIDPGHTALLVIDMQNDFCDSDGVMAQQGNELASAQGLAERLPGLVGRARETGALIIFVKSVYTTSDNKYLSPVWLEQASRRGKLYNEVPVCEEGSWGGEFYSGLAPRPGDVTLVKHRFSAFQGTELDALLRSNEIKTLIVTGIVSNICVESTVRDGFMRDYYIVLPEDGAAAYRDRDHAGAMEVLGTYFAELSTVADIESAWKQP